MDSILYKNFAALKRPSPPLTRSISTTRNSFDSASTIAFGVMLGQLGYKVKSRRLQQITVTGRTWSRRSTVSSRATVDGVHLQAYAGGSGNNPCVGWDFGSVPVWPGLWDLFDTPAQVQKHHERLE
jgi:hypothetical protein